MPGGVLRQACCVAWLYLILDGMEVRMALIKCPECGKEISDSAYNCPGCGCPMRRRQQPVQYSARPASRGCAASFFGALKGIAIVVLSIMVLMSFVGMVRGCFGGSSSVSEPPTSSGTSRDDMSAEKAAALMLNLNGHLCAEATRITPLKQPKVYEVRCIEYRGGRGTVDYVLDMNTGVGWRR